MNNTQQIPEIPASILQCWMHAFKQCKVDVQSVTVYCSESQWYSLARNSKLSTRSARLCCHQHMARIQIFNEQWEPEERDLVTFHIMHHWTDELLIVARE